MLGLTDLGLLLSVASQVSDQHGAVPNEQLVTMELQATEAIQLKAWCVFFCSKNGFQNVPKWPPLS